MFVKGLQQPREWGSACGFFGAIRIGPVPERSREEPCIHCSRFAFNIPVHRIQ
jgi:hypothetical protein